MESIQIGRYFHKFFSSCDSSQDHQDSLKKEQKFAAYFGILLFLIAILWRSWDNFCNPGLHFEDSMYYFNPFYGNHPGSISGILHQYNGYYVFFTKSVAYLIAKADITLQPYLYQFFALGLCTLTISAFSFSGLITNRWLLIISPTLLGLSGLNHLFYFITICYLVYVTPILLLLLLLSRKRPVGILKILLPIIFLILIWSSPFSVLIVPFCLTYLVLFRDRISLSLFLMAATVAYVLTVEQGTVLLGQLFQSEILAHWGIALVTQVFFMGFVKTVNTEKILLVASVFAIILVLLNKDRDYLKTAILILALIIASFAPFFLSIKFLLYRFVFHSHAVIGQFFWLVFILFTIERILYRYPQHAHKGGIVFASLILFFVFADNIRHPEKVRAEIYTEIPKFTKIIKEYEPQAPQLREQGKEIIVSIERQGIFKPMAIIGDRSKNATTVKHIFVESEVR